jgi:hypothetical protein
MHDEKGRLVLLRLAPRGCRTEIAGQVEEVINDLVEKAGKKAHKIRI